MSAHDDQASGPDPAIGKRISKKFFILQLSNTGRVRLVRRVGIGFNDINFDVGSGWWVLVAGGGGERFSHTRLPPPTPTLPS